MTSSTGERLVLPSGDQWELEKRVFHPQHSKSCEGGHQLERGRRTSEQWLAADNWPGLRMLGSAIYFWNCVCLNYS